jgi:hypothetical protein
MVDLSYKFSVHKDELHIVQKFQSRIIASVQASCGSLIIKNFISPNDIEDLVIIKYSQSEITIVGSKSFIEVKLVKYIDKLLSLFNSLFIYCSFISANIVKISNTELCDYFADIDANEIAEILLEIMNNHKNQYWINL